MKKLIATGLIAITLAGCGSYNDKRGLGDAPVMNRKGDDKAAVVINFPDTFANIAIKCYKGNGLYVTTRNAAPLVVKDDPLCDGNVVVSLEGK